MLIHLGDNEFIGLHRVVGIFHVHSLDRNSTAKIRGVLTKTGEKRARTGVLTTSGTWVGSTLSADSLAGRGRWLPPQVFESLDALRKQKNKSMLKESSEEKLS